MGNRKLTIAIDGPAGAGKSTVARHVAQALGYMNLESGAMYRALALKALEQHVSLEEETALLQLAERSNIELEPTCSGNRVLLDSRDVSRAIRQAEVTDAASRLSVHPQVRQWMVDRQRVMGDSGGVVMEGRDIGTKVFPDAEVKVFLEASAEVRAVRRMLQESNTVREPSTIQVIADEIRKRDQRDRTRAASPLVPAPDAITIDSSSLEIEEVVNRILALVQAKLQNLDAGVGTG